MIVVVVMIVVMVVMIMVVIVVMVVVIMVVVMIMMTGVLRVRIQFFGSHLLVGCFFYMICNAGNNTISYQNIFTGTMVWRMRVCNVNLF